MHEFDPQEAIKILKKAAKKEFDHTSQCRFPIFVNKSIIHTDKEERKKAFHCERMESDGIIKQFKEIQNGTVYTLYADAFDIIDDEDYPAIADEPFDNAPDGDVVQPSPEHGFWYQVWVNITSNLIEKSILLILGMILGFVLEKPIKSLFESDESTPVIESNNTPSDT